MNSINEILRMVGLERDVYCLKCKEIVENPYEQKNYSALSDNLALCDKCVEEKKNMEDK